MSGIFTVTPSVLSAGETLVGAEDSPSQIDFSLLGAAGGNEIRLGSWTIETGWTGGSATIGGVAVELSGFSRAVGTEGADTIRGFDHPDGEPFPDEGGGLLIGAGGNDVIFGAELVASDSVSELQGGTGADTLVGTAGDDHLYGESGADSLLGGDGHDYLDGGSWSNDTVIAGDGNDTVAGAERVEAGKGEDWVYVPISGATVLDGGSEDYSDPRLEQLFDADVLSFARFRGGVELDLSTGSYDLGPASGTHSHFEGIEGTRYGDTLTGITNLRVTGGAGDDLLIAGDGQLDTGGLRISGGDGADTIISTTYAGSFRPGRGADLIELPADAPISHIIYDDLPSGGIVFDGGAATVGGAAGGDTILGEFAIVGSASRDVFRTSAGLDVLEGRAGDDVMIGFTEYDTLRGGEGFDTLDLRGRTGGIGLNLGNGKIYVDVGRDAADLPFGGSVEGFERVYGSDFADRFTASDAASILYGRGGDDVLDGGAGADSLFGGAGNDIFQGSLDDGDRIEGGGGWDLVSFRDLGAPPAEETEPGVATGAAPGVMVDLAAGTAFVEGSVTTLAGIEAVEGGWGADTLSGSARAESLSGGAGNDLLAGEGGRDTLSGGAGADVFHVTAPGQGYDNITDFTPGEDRIRLGEAFEGFTFLAGPLPMAGLRPGERRIGYDTDDGRLLWNPDGLGGAPPVLLAVLENKPALTLADFILA